MMRKRGQPTAALNVRIDPAVVRALNVYVVLQDRYVYEVVEEAIEDWLKAKGTSVANLLKLGEADHRGIGGSTAS